MTRSPWTDEDRALLLAFSLYEESLCSCGEPRNLAHHPDNEGWYTIDNDPEEGSAVVCNACAAIEKNKAEAEKSDLPYGLRPVLVHDRDYEAKPLPPLPTKR